MGIAKVVRPEVIASGFVTSSRPRERREDKKVYRYDITIQQESGAALVVEYWVREGEPLNLPGVGLFWAVVAEVGESAQYGASLSYVRDLSADDIDRIHSALTVPAGK